MVYNNEAKLKEQNSSRLTEPKNELTVTKGKGTGEDGWEGRYKRGKGSLQLAHLMQGVGGVTWKAV